MINQNFHNLLMKIQNKNNIFKDIEIYGRISFSER